VEQLHQMQSPAAGDAVFDDAAREIREEMERKHCELIITEIINKKLSAHIGKYDGIFARLCLLWHCIDIGREMVILNASTIA
jgi:hypothetical protein